MRFRCALIVPLLLIGATAVRAGEPVSAGQSVYNDHCAACHQVGGEGIPGVSRLTRATSPICTTPRAA